LLFSLYHNLEKFLVLFSHFLKTRLLLPLWKNRILRSYPIIIKTNCISGLKFNCHCNREITLFVVVIYLDDFGQCGQESIKPIAYQPNLFNRIINWQFSIHSVGMTRYKRVIQHAIFYWSTL
jgi:hypothetical protein